MSGPKHLWSGDWERESTVPAEPVERPDPDGADLPAASPARRRPGRPRLTRPSPTRIAAAVGLGVAILVVVIVLIVSGSGSSQRPSPQVQAQANAQAPSPAQAPTPTIPAPAQTPAAQMGPPYNWLGMQISDTPSGITVATITGGGEGDLAGLNPGDIITAVGASATGTVAQLQTALARDPLHRPVTLTIERGSTTLTLTASLTDRPVRQP